MTKATDDTIHITARIPIELATALDAIKIRYGTPISEQLRRALMAWIKQGDPELAHSITAWRAERNYPGARRPTPRKKAKRS